MFFGASLFNQPLNNWNTSHITTMEGMFYKASSFNQNIRNWNTSNVTATNLFDVESGLESQNKPIF